MKQPVAAFDFDGTIASGDAVIPFVSRVAGWAKTLQALATIAPLARHRDRDLLKERFLAETLTGKTQEELTHVGEKFARHLRNERVRETMVDRIDWHRNQGHRLVIVSASLDLYLEPLGQFLGFDDVVCTRIEFADGRATGKLVDGNVRSDNKVYALQKLAGDDHSETWAYGNSSGDVPMLAKADHPFWVTRTGEIRAWFDNN